MVRMTRFTHAVPMRWSDMDAYRHVNNIAYLAYLEQARIAMFFHRHDGFADGTVISRHEIDYVRPIVYHAEPLRIETWIDSIGGARFTICYEIIDGDVLAARASTTCVTFDFAAGRPRRLTDEEREVLRHFADDA